MEIKPDFERLKKTINHNEPDRVPLCELLIDYTHQSRFLGRQVTPDDLASQVEFWTKAGYDFIPITVGMMTPGRVTKESDIIKVIRKTMLKEEKSQEDDEKSWNLEYTSFINNRDDFDRFPWDVAANVDLTVIHEVSRYLPSGMKAIVMSGKIFTLTWMLMGFNNFSTALIMDENLVADVFTKVAEIQSKAIDSILSLPHVGGIWVVDDIAFGTGPIISPNALRAHLFPRYAEMARKCHALNLPLIMHSDGDMTALIPDLIEMGLDVLHPIDPTCMDIAKIKLEWGDELCLFGNVSNELLRSGSPAEVAQYTRKLLREVAPGGGFALGSGNSVPAWAKYENYLAMRDTACQYGAYPIVG